MLLGEVVTGLRQVVRVHLSQRPLCQLCHQVELTKMAAQVAVSSATSMLQSWEAEVSLAKSRS